MSNETENKQIQHAEANIIIKGSEQKEMIYVAEGDVDKIKIQDYLKNLNPKVKIVTAKELEHAAKDDKLKAK